MEGVVVYYPPVCNIYQEQLETNVELERFKFHYEIFLVNIMMCLCEL